MPARKSRSPRSVNLSILERLQGNRTRAIETFVLLAAFWLLISGHYTPLLMSLGALSVILVIWVTFRMAVIDDESLPLRLSPRLPRYLLWLTGQILLSSLAVLRLVWSPRRRLRPAIGTVPADGLPDLSKVIYANSITLTPGTLSLALTEEAVVVHALRGDDLDGVREGTMRDRVRRLEER